MHSHSPDHRHGKTDSSRNIAIAFFLNLVFTIIEFVGGVMTNSVAILSDAIHDLGDTVALAVSWYLEKFSRKGRDKYFTYGYLRFSLLGAIFISGMLLVGSVLIIRESVVRIMDPEPVDAVGMLWLAILGVVVNGAAVLRLSKGNSLNERAVYLHLLEDVLGWVAVLVVSVVMLYADVPVLDPLLSIGICAWILINIYKNLKSTFKVLLQQVPEDVDLSALQNAILSIEGIKSIHDVHLWSMDGREHIMTLHVVTASSIGLSQLSELKLRIRELCDAHGVHHPTIEFESEEEDCEMVDC